MATELPRVAAGLDYGRNILFVGAHCDDIEIGCGGIAAKLATLGHKITFAVAADCGAERSAEAREAAAKLGLRPENGGLVLGTFPDRELEHHQPAMQKWLDDLRRSLQPDTVFVHHADTNHDHAAVFETAIRCFNDQTILQYYVPQTLNRRTDFSPNHVEDISEYMETKLQLCACHKSQASKGTYLNPEGTKALGVVYFLQANSGPTSPPHGYGEPFYIHTLRKPSTDGEDLPPFIVGDLDLSEKTYHRYNAIEVPLLEAPEFIDALAARYRCAPLAMGSRTYPAAVIWQNKDRLIAPDSILGGFDHTPPSPLEQSAILSPPEYSAARAFIKRTFEEGPIKEEGVDFRMTTIDVGDDLPKINGAYGFYYDNILTQRAMEWELKKALLNGGTDPLSAITRSGSLPLREAAERRDNPLRDGTGRCAALSVSTLLIFKLRQQDEFYVLMNRRSDKVGVSPGMLHLVPSGMFEAHDDGRWSVEANVWSELLEEVYDDRRQQTKGRPEFQDRIRLEAPIALLINMIKSGTAEFSVTGLYLDLLNLQPEITTVLLVRDYAFPEDRQMKLNWEYVEASWSEAFGNGRVRWSGIDEVVEKAGAGRGLTVAGAACLSLGRDWLKHRHGI